MADVETDKEQYEGVQVRDGRENFAAYRATESDLLYQDVARAACKLVV